MKILHLTTGRILFEGQRNQLQHEVSAATKSGLQWDTVALHTEMPVNSFEKQIPRLFRSAALLRLYGWLYAIRHSKKYDFVLFRDLQLDPFGPVLGPLVKNRITVHHAKELQELSGSGRGTIDSRIRVSFEKWVKPLTMRSARGLIGVTNEIKDYEVDRFPHLRDRAYVMPNGYRFKQLTISDSGFSSAEINVVFVCTNFSFWQGLDRLLEAARVADKPEKKINIHLVGSLTEKQLEDVENSSTDFIDFICHGPLGKDELSSLFSISRLAIGSLALDRKGLTEATTLKTRDYLAAGLPVYATHIDTALPSDFPYFYNDSQGVSIERLLKYVDSLNQFGKQEVRDASVRYLDKALIMEKLITELYELNSK